MKERAQSVDFFFDSMRKYFYSVPVFCHFTFDCSITLRQHQVTFKIHTFPFFPLSFIVFKLFSCVCARVSVVQFFILRNI